MSRISKRHQHWDEFRWEEEIRRDERRISGYFRELAGCLDLPDEEELIYGQLSSQPDLVPFPETGESLRDYFGSSEDDDDELPEHPANCRTVESSTVEELDMLCAEWNIFIAAKLPALFYSHALGCSCAFAKLLARTADFLEPEPDTSKALQLSLGKRTLRDLNETVQLLSTMAGYHEFFREKAENLISRLGEIRERLIAKLDSLR